MSIEEAKAIRAELLNIQQSLSTGEQEKIELMKSLACLEDDLTRLQPAESSLDVSVINAHEKFSTASQTDLSGEVKIKLKVVPFLEILTLQKANILCYYVPPPNMKTHKNIYPILDGACGSEVSRVGKVEVAV